NKYGESDERGAQRRFEKRLRYGLSFLGSNLRRLFSLQQFGWGERHDGRRYIRGRQCAGHAIDDGKLRTGILYYARQNDTTGDRRAAGDDSFELTRPSSDDLQAD